jgi:replicative DNA helicase
MVIIDYLQLIRGDIKVERRDLEVAYVSHSLKALAKELDIPVVACAQLNRGLETRGKEKIPQLSDLRESGAIEQDADVVMFVYRPCMSEKPPNKEDTEEYQKFQRKANIFLRKQRNGPIDDFELVFNSEYATFDNKREEPVLRIPSEEDYQDSSVF